MKTTNSDPVGEARREAIRVLIANMRGPCGPLPRTAGWGYPEPYTRDLMIASLGILVSGEDRLVRMLRRVLETLARNQNRLGFIPSLVNEPDNLGASDTTPLFLIGLALFRRFSGERDFLEKAAAKALRSLEHQSPTDTVMVAQQPTSDWRDEQWVWGYGLYVNALVYIALLLHGQGKRAATLRELMHLFDIKSSGRFRYVHAAMALRSKPYFALCSYKIHRSERFDLLGNSLAMLSGLASPSRARKLIAWIEAECDALRRKNLLALDLPPCFFPYIRPEDPDWRPRYAKYNRPGEYHNGGVWPFVCGFYVAALAAAGRRRLAAEKLLALARLVKPARDAKVPYGFNEWFRAQDGAPHGQDWQSWSAAMFLYAAAAVEQGDAPFFEDIRLKRASRVRAAAVRSRSAWCFPAE